MLAGSASSDEFRADATAFRSGHRSTVRGRAEARLAAQARWAGSRHGHPCDTWGARAGRGSRLLDSVRSAAASPLEVPEPQPATAPLPLPERSDRDPAAPERPRFTVRSVLQVLLALGLLLGVVLFLVRTFRPELQATGRSFVSHFGLGGIVLGTFLADGFHFPVPPQFYMLLAVAAGDSSVKTLGAISLGSLCGGSCAYLLAQRLARIQRFARWLDRNGRSIAHYFEGPNAYRGAALISITPVAFSVVCYVSGLYRLGTRPFLLVLALRLPKLLIYYQLVKLGWSGF
jgi:membrane protein YqaA with SNARE-associated domain